MDFHQYSPVRIPVVVWELQKHFLAVEILVGILVGEALLDTLSIAAKFCQHASFRLRLVINGPSTHRDRSRSLSDTEAWISPHVMLTAEDLDTVSLLKIDLVILRAHFELAHLGLIEWSRAVDAQSIWGVQISIIIAPNCDSRHCVQSSIGVGSDFGGLARRRDLKNSRWSWSIC